MMNKEVLAKFVDSVFVKAMSMGVGFDRIKSMLPREIEVTNQLHRLACSSPTCDGFMDADEVIGALKERFETTLTPEQINVLAAEKYGPPVDISTQRERSFFYHGAAVALAKFRVPPKTLLEASKWLDKLGKTWIDDSIDNEVLFEEIKRALFIAGCLDD